MSNEQEIVLVAGKWEESDAPGFNGGIFEVEDADEYIYALEALLDAYDEAFAAAVGDE